ncbi:MAG: SdpI family protein [Lawsonibacter sp.]|jgi:hypothetical protein|nr:SdpI family protein [Syntrophaceticus schinkii]MDD4262699.1 SdpI family protein [Syntrophaceticus schinkii]MDD4675705.1 SdpI family protein [Syntrophaceticus schinkii]
MNEEIMIISILHIITGLLFIALSIPLVKGSLKMNTFYGVKIKKAYESEENWIKINKYGGKRLIFWSTVLICIGIITLFVNISANSLLFFVLVFAPIIVLIPCIIEIYIFANKL